MVIREWLKKYNADEILFFLAVIFKPFYLLPSGSFQIGDFLFFAAVLVHFLKGGNKELFVPIHREEHSLLIFVTGVLIINLTYYVLIGTKDFLVNSAYYVFNFLIVLFATDIMHSPRKDVFLQGLCNSCKIVIIIQLFIFIVGKSSSTERYIGTFNDPNQFAVYILFCMVILMDYYHKVGILTVSWAMVGAFLIVFSGSTGALLAIATFLLLSAIINITSSNTVRRHIALVTIISGVAILILAITVINSAGNTGVLGMLKSRFAYKLQYSTNIRDMANFIINDRIWNRVFEQPKYLLYGAGEGAHIRFDSIVWGREIHSSILGPMFYYGIWISTFLFIWEYKKLKHADAIQVCLYVSVILESLILVNYRQPLFWLLFVLAGREKGVFRSVYKTKNVDFIKI